MSKKKSATRKRMNGFLRVFHQVETLNNWGIGQYHLCWFPFPNQKGFGFFSSIDFADDDLSRIDPNKVEIIYPKPVQK